ncbi:hypothetical protein PI126_g18784 [Phytophthora idaei]|nr:hypothetical protein PI126_g18784 [Phytophthora idaei]
MLDARDLLDGMLGVQPTFRSYLGLGLYGAPDAPIVHSPKFDSAIVKVLGGKYHGCLQQRKPRCSHFDVNHR